MTNDHHIPFMECRNLVTVNDSYDAPNTLYGMWKPYNSQYPMVSHTLYGMWEPCNGVPHMYDVGNL